MTNTATDANTLKIRWWPFFLVSLTFVAALALLGLLGYVSGLRWLASVRPDYIPMAPSTAICFLILTISSLTGNRRNKIQVGSIIYPSLALLVSLFGLLTLFGYFTGAELNFEAVLLPEFEELNGLPIGRMSPATGLAFFVAGLATFFMLIFQNQIRQRSAFDYLSGALSLAVFSIGFVFSLAYLFQTPLLYQIPGTIPMALTTALGVLVLAVALIIWRPAGFPLRLLTENSTRSYLLRAILPLAVISTFLGLIADFLPLHAMNLNPGVLSAAITILVVLAVGMVSTWMSRSIGTQIDQKNKQIMKAKEEAEQNAAYLSMLIEKTPLPMVITNKNQDIEFFNEKFTETFGYTLADISTAEVWWQTAYPDETYRQKVQNSWMKAIDRALENKTDIDMQQWDLTIKDGTKRSCEFYMIPLGSKNLIVTHDITERKKAIDELIAVKNDLELKVAERTKELDERLKRLNKSEQAMLYMVEDLNHLTAELKEEQRKLLLANKELEAFSYSVSHDLRAPLRHITGYVDLLNEKFRADLSEKAQYYLNTVTGAAKQMGTLIDELLQFSRTGRQELRKSTINMNVLVKDVIEIIKSDTEKRAIMWEIQLLPYVFGDLTLLKQVWVNLLDNAVKYTRNTIKAEISIGYREEEKYFVFFVRDNGVGFNMKYAHKLFGVFQRLHSQSEFEGTGIGLANVQRIIHKHNGRVWAEAESGKGATFHFSLPKSKN